MSEQEAAGRRDEVSADEQHDFIADHQNAASDAAERREEVEQSAELAAETTKQTQSAGAEPAVAGTEAEPSTQDPEPTPQPEFTTQDPEPATQPESSTQDPEPATQPESSTQDPEPSTPEEISADELLAQTPPSVEPSSAEDAQLRAVLEAIIYVSEEPLTIQQITAALEQPRERIEKLLGEIVADFDKPEHGLSIREVAGGFKMFTKPEHHDAVRNFVKSLKPPLKLSLAALETLAVIAYKQPITGPEIMEIRGVQGGGVLKTLLDRKLIAAAGRKNVIGKPILYKTTKEFLVQFGLKDLLELPSLKEFEEIRRMAISDSEPPAEAAAQPEAPAAPAEEPEPVSGEVDNG